MIPTSKAAAIMFGFLKKAFTFHNGALVFMAVPASPYVVNIIDYITAAASQKELTMPLLCVGTGLFCYFIIFLSDFVTGIRAAKYEANGAAGYIKSDKLWSSFWKLYGVFITLFFLTVFCLMFAVLQLSFLYHAFLYAIVGVLIMVTLFDIHSIGENHLRRYGKKPALFEFLDRATKAIDENIMKRLKSL